MLTVRKIENTTVGANSKPKLAILVANCGVRRPPPTACAHAHGPAHSTARSTSPRMVLDAHMARPAATGDVMARCDGAIGMGDTREGTRPPEPHGRRARSRRSGAAARCALRDRSRQRRLTTICGSSRSVVVSTAHCCSCQLAGAGRVRLRGTGAGDTAGAGDGEPRAAPAALCSTDDAVLSTLERVEARGLDRGSSVFTGAFVEFLRCVIADCVLLARGCGRRDARRARRARRAATSRGRRGRREFLDPTHGDHVLRPSWSRRPAAFLRSVRRLRTQS